MWAAFFKKLTKAHYPPDMCPFRQIPNQHTDILTQYWKGLEDKRLCQSDCFIHRLWHVLLFETAVRQTRQHSHTLHLALSVCLCLSLSCTTSVCLIIWQQGAHCAVLWLCRAAHHPEGRNIFKIKGLHLPLQEPDITSRACEVRGIQM